MNDLKAAIQRLYGVRAEAVTLLRHNENRTYRVDAPGGEYVLRIRQPVKGFTLGPLSDGESAWSFARRETALLCFLCSHGYPAQQPLLTLGGDAVAELDGMPATLYHWLDGTPLSELDMDDALCEKMGAAVARLHRLLSTFDREHPTSGLTYDEHLLSRLSASLERALSAGAMSENHVRAMQDALSAVGTHMRRLGPMQTVHADLSRSNLILTQSEVAPIDYSLSGLCHVQMDVASLFAQDGKPSRAAILRGYACGGGTDIAFSDVEPYFALQILLFACCQWPRFCREEWFDKALLRWQRETFSPLVRGERFLMM